MTEEKKFGVKVCRERKCTDLKVRDPKYPQSGEQCEVTGGMPGAMGCCPKEMTDEQFIKRANLNYGPYSARPGPKNCPGECPYKIIIDGEKFVWKKGESQGIKVPAKIPTCALTGYSLKDSGLCPCNVLGNPRQEDQIKRLKALVKMRLEYCSEDNPTVGMCAMGICPDGKDRERWGDDKNESFCPVIRLPTSALMAGRGCPLWRIPAKLLPAESGISPKTEIPAEKEIVKSKLQNTVKRNVQHKPPSDIKKHPHSDEGGECFGELWNNFRDCDDCTQNDACHKEWAKHKRNKSCCGIPEVKKKVNNEVNKKAEEPPAPLYHRDVDGDECGGGLYPVWHRGRWLYICEECGYQEIPTKEQLSDIAQLVERGEIEAPPVPPADKVPSRQAALFDFKPKEDDECTEPEKAPCNDAATVPTLPRACQICEGKDRCLRHDPRAGCYLDLKKFEKGVEEAREEPAEEKEPPKDLSENDGCLTWIPEPEKSESAKTLYHILIEPAEQYSMYDGLGYKYRVDIGKSDGGEGYIAGPRASKEGVIYWVLGYLTKWQNSETIPPDPIDAPGGNLSYTDKTVSFGFFDFYNEDGSLKPFPDEDPDREATKRTTKKPRAKKPVSPEGEDEVEEKQPEQLSGVCKRCDVKDTCTTYEPYTNCKKIEARKVKKIPGRNPICKDCGKRIVCEKVDTPENGCSDWERTNPEESAPKKKESKP